MLWDVKQGLSGNIPRWCWWLEQYPNKHRLCILTSHCTNQKLGIVTWKEMLVSLLISSPPTVAKLSFCHYLSCVDIPVRPWENSRWICDVFHLEHPRDSHLADVCAFVRVIFTWRGLRHPSTSFYITSRRLSVTTTATAGLSESFVLVAATSSSRLSLCWR